MICTRIGKYLLDLSQRFDRPGYPWYCWTLDTVGGWFTRVGYRSTHGVWLP